MPYQPVNPFFKEEDFKEQLEVSRLSWILDPPLWVRHTNSVMQKEGGSVFILQRAVSGHHYLMLQMESCKQMLVVPLNGNSVSGCGSSTGEKEDPKMLRHDNGDKH